MQFVCTEQALQVHSTDKGDRGWQHIWQHDLTSLNFTGFLAPLYANGTRDPSFSTLYCGVYCSWSDVTYEGLPWEYSWSIPYDMSTLISYMGGPQTTEARLDAMFIPGLQNGGVGAGNGAGTAIFNPGNEPSFGTPFLYNYLGRRQWKSVLRSRAILDEYYSNERDGVPGNSDAGALESWMVWNMIGAFRVLHFPCIEKRILTQLRPLSYGHARRLPHPFAVLQGSEHLGRWE